MEDFNSDCFSLEVCMIGPGAGVEWVGMKMANSISTKVQSRMKKESLLLSSNACLDINIGCGWFT